jgi:hypothetical protein
LNLEALPHDAGIVGHVQLVGACGALPQMTVTVVDDITNVDNLDIACSEEDDQMISSGMDNAGKEKSEDENVDDEMSEDGILPSATAEPSVRDATEPFTLCSRCWRAPYAVQLHYQAGSSRGPSTDE